ncbi:MMPL family transporter [Cryomorphaceae bacterium]|nr:MMPL family transporter [Cryomorphaceae bacterium]
MWTFIARIILRNRITLLVAIGLITAFMGYQAQFVQMDYEYARLLPKDDTTNVGYENFKDIFGDEGNIIVVGIQDPNLREYQNFKQWNDLADTLAEQPGVTGTLILADALIIERNDSLQAFDVHPVMPEFPKDQAELDSLREVLLNLPFYRGILYNPETGATLMAISLEKDILNDKARVRVVNNLRRIIADFTEQTGLETHTSGFPYIRTVNAEKVQDEILMFVLMALLVTALILYLFFRSFRAMLFSMVVVVVAVVWSMGFIVLFGFKVSLLTALIPPLIIVIGVPNCIFLLNKYHQEYVKHGNQVKALSRVIHKIGNATLMTNATTASGFATFILTSSRVLVEFGILASVNIMAVFVLSLLLIPIIFSFAKPPKTRHVQHLERQWINKVVDWMLIRVQYKRTSIYVTTAILITAGIFGMLRMRKTGNLAEDLPQDAKLYQDLVFFEENFNGVLPFEIMIDTKRPNGVTSLTTMKRMDALQGVMSEKSELSRSLSIVDLAKFSKQAFYGGDTNFYTLPNSQDKNFIFSYVNRSNTEASSVKMLVDSTGRYARISANIADIGTREMDSLKRNLRPQIDSLFNPDRYDVTMTGTSVVFIMGTNYLVKNLVVSLALAIFLIALFMAWMFRSARMVIVSLIPNLIPLLLTAAMMGYFNIPIKPSTILVFSIAFGISVDDTIHFLAKYRQELKVRQWDIKESVLQALRETGVSMTYTSIVLFFGFSIFMASQFGGTKALGMLVSLTLLIAMLANLLLLPSLLLTLQKRITTRTFQEPLIDILDEEEDIDLDELVVRKEEESENNTTS